MTAKHNERCKECKKRINDFLSEIYGEGEVVKEYSLNRPSRIQEYKGETFYDSLNLIYINLQNYRDMKEFVKAKKLPKVDFYVPNNPGFILEIDESQHFTKPREITLKNYPETLKLCFEKDIWIKRCVQLNRKDNFPDYRDEQRAWYDTLKDFSSIYLNKPIIRIIPEDSIWCKLNIDDKNDVKWFEDYIQHKLFLAKN